MLTFLRKIRRTLIGSSSGQQAGGSSRTYLIYAVGEIALVVIGILIALQINNWNQNRIDRTKEKLLLKEINAEFVYNKEELRSTLEYYARVRKKYLNLIKSFPISLNDYNLDSVAATFHRTNSTLDVDISQGSIATLINSSSFEIITNPELRSLLLQWNDLVSNYKEAESMLIEFTVDKFFPYMDDRVPYFYDEGIKDKRVDLSFLSTVKFENLIKRRSSLIRNMIFISEIENNHLINTIDRIIELSAHKIQ